MIKRILFLFFMTGATSFHVSFSQEPLKYQMPPDDIVKIVDAPSTPVVSVSPDGSVIVVIDRPPIITMKELSAEELRLGGIRINPATNGPGRQTLNKGFRLMNIDGTNPRIISGIPVNAALGCSPVVSRRKQIRIYEYHFTRDRAMDLRC